MADSTGAAAGGNGDGGGADADGGGTGIPAAPAVGAIRRRLGAVHRSILWAHRRVHRAARYGLIVYGVILGGVGLLDIYRGLNLEVRTDGALLLLAGVAAVGGCTVALRRGADIPPHRWWVIGADGAAFAVSAWLGYRVQSNFVLQLVLQPWLFISAVVVVLAGLFSALVLYGDVSERRDPPSSAAAQEERPARATLLAGALGALGTLLAAALTLPQFWYSSHYEPSNAPPVVAVENSIDDVETRGDHVEFSVSITVENKGKTPVRMLTSLYEISGTRVTVGQEAVTPQGLPYEKITGGNYGAPARLNAYAAYGEPELIQVGPAGEDYAWIGPDEKVHTKLRAQAPRGRFHLLRITTDVAVARADRVEVEDGPQPGGRELKTCNGTRIAENRRNIASLGALDWLTESHRELVTFWAVSGKQGDESPWWPAFPWTGVSIQHDGHDCGHALEPDHDGLEDRAMLGWASSVAEAAVPTEPSPKP